MKTLLAAALALCFPIVALAGPAPEVRTLITNLESLDEVIDDAAREALYLPVNHEARLGWSYFPGDRAGLRLGNLDPRQRAAVMDILRGMLSGTGFAKIEQIRKLESVLKQMENNPGRDLENYYLTVFGDPSEEDFWGVRWEGHHISLNWSIQGGTIVSSTPQFLGSNPATVPQGHTMAGERVQRAEEELARSLVRSMTRPQREQAVLVKRAPAEILTRMQGEVSPLPQEGIRYADLEGGQQGLLMQMIEQYASTQSPFVMRQRLDRIKESGLDDIYFYWIGSLHPEEGHYYRIQGPSFLIEYDNTQNNANHIHTVWRDFDGDFGRDVLKEHYEEAALLSGSLLVHRHP
jgi:hypothetical protein